MLSPYFSQIQQVCIYSLVIFTFLGKNKETIKNSLVLKVEIALPKIAKVCVCVCVYVTKEYFGVSRNDGPNDLSGKFGQLTNENTVM